MPHGRGTQCTGKEGSEREERLIQPHTKPKLPDSSFSVFSEGDTPSSRASSTAASATANRDACNTQDMIDKLHPQTMSPPDKKQLRHYVPILHV